MGRTTVLVRETRERWQAGMRPQVLPRRDGGTRSAAAGRSAAYGERSPERITRRNGYRPRPGHARRQYRAANPEAAPGQLLPGPARAAPARRARPARGGPAGLRGGRLDPPRRRPRAFARLRGHLQEPVSRICAELDSVVTSFLERPLDGGPYRYLWLDALTRVREEGRIAQVSVDAQRDGKREVLGIDVGTSEDGAFWLHFSRPGGAGPVRRGTRTSDAHQGLKAAIATVFGGASWQRCRTHFMRNLLTRVPKSAEALVRRRCARIFQQPSADGARPARPGGGATGGALPRGRSGPRRAGGPRFTACPVAHWKPVVVEQPQERLEPGDPPAHRRGRHLAQPRRGRDLVGAVLGEQHDEWAVARRYMTMVTLLHPPGREVTSGRRCC